MNYLLLFLGGIFIFIIVKKLNTNKKEFNEDISDEEKKNYIDNFFDRKIDYQCLPYPPNDKSICKIDKNRGCITKNQPFCEITGKDTADAWDYAYQRLCIDKGHCLAKHSDGSMTCEFTKETCLKASLNDKDVSQEFKNQELLDENGENLTGDELKEAEKSLKYGKLYWLDGVGCVNGSQVNIDKFEKFCSDNHPCSMGKWKFDKNNFTCKITKEYCNALEMDYENGKCEVSDPVAEALFGSSMVRGISNCPPYADVWGGGIGSDDHEKIRQEKCIDPYFS